MSTSGKVPHPSSLAAHTELIYSHASLSPARHCSKVNREEPNTLLPAQPTGCALRGHPPAYRGDLHRHAYGSRRVSRPERPDSGHHDRSQRYGSRGSGTARHLPRRNSRKRGYRRAPCPFFFDQRFLRCLGRVRLGHRYIPRPSDRQRKARRSQRVTSRQRGQADSRPPIVHLGRNAHRRSDRRLHLHARSADDCRLDDPPAPALHRRRGTGGSARRRHQGISDSVGPRTDAPLRRIDGRSDGRHPRHEPERQRRRTLRIWQ